MITKLVNNKYKKQIKQGVNPLVIAKRLSTFNSILKTQRISKCL